MPEPDPGPCARSDSGIDWDSLVTMVLTIVVVAALAGLPLLLALGRVGWIGLRAGGGAAGDPLVVFGKRLVDDAVDADYRARLVTAAALAGKGRRRIILLGGRTGDAPLTEAEAGQRFLQGLPGGGDLDIELEQASSNTLTNLHNLRRLLSNPTQAPAGPAEAMTLITNRYHLARVDQMAASLHLPHRCCAAETRRLALRPGQLPKWLVESFYVTWFITGKLWAMATGNRRMLARIT